MSDPIPPIADGPANLNPDEVLFAEQVQAVLPTLPAEALARVQQRMQREIALVQCGQRQRWWQKRTWRVGMAAAVVLALASGASLLLLPTPSGDAIDPELVQRRDRVAPPALVEDRITVAVGTSRNVPVEQPLVHLEENQSLFTN